MDIKSMTAGQIAAMTLEQFNILTAAEARQALAKVRRSVNQRERRLTKALDYMTPALKQMEKSGGLKLKPAGTNRNENLAELKRGIDFLNMKTSTVPGARKHFEQAVKDLGLSKSASAETVREAYREFEKAQEDFGGLLSRESGEDRYRELKRRIGKWSENGWTDDEIRTSINEFYERASANEEAATNDILNGIEQEYYKNVHISSEDYNE